VLLEPVWASEEAQVLQEHMLSLRCRLSPWRRGGETPFDSVLACA